MNAMSDKDKDKQKEEFVARALLKRKVADVHGAAVNSTVPIERRGLDMTTGSPVFQKQTRDMHKEVLRKLNPRLKRANRKERKGKSPLTVVHPLLFATAAFFFVGSGGFTGSAADDRMPLLLVHSWPPHDSLGLLADQRVGFRLLSANGFPSDTALCALLKLKSVLGADAPQNFMEMLSEESLARSLWGTMDAVPYDLEGNPTHSLPDDLRDLREELGALCWWCVVGHRLLKWTCVWLEGVEGKGALRAAEADGAESIAGDEEFNFPPFRTALCASDPRLNAYAGLDDESFLGKLCHGAVVFKDTRVIVVAGTPLFFNPNFKHKPPTMNPEPQTPNPNF